MSSSSSPRAAKRVVLLLIVPLLAATAEGDTAPPFTASYAIYVSGLLLGRMERSLVLEEDGTYIFQSDSRAIGLATLLHGERVHEQSLWRVKDGQMLPIEYSYRRSGGKKSRTVLASFDWTQGKLSNRIDDQDSQLPLASGTFDKLLYELAMMRDLKSGQDRFEYHIADGNQIKTYRFVRSGEETLATPLGNVKAYKLERINMKEGRKTTVWSAPSLHYLPVRVDNVGGDGRLSSVIIKAVTWTSAESGATSGRHPD